MKIGSKKIKFNQKIVVFVIFGMIALIVMLFIGRIQPEQSTSINETSHIENVDSNLSKQEIWHHRQEERIIELKNELSTVKTEFNNQKVTMQKTMLKKEKALQIQIKELRTLHNQILKKQKNEDNKSKENESLSNHQQTSNVKNTKSIKDKAFGGAESISLAITKTIVRLSMPPIVNSPDNTIPATTIVPSIILGGVDAGTGVNNTANPRPVILEMLNSGSLPRKYQSDLKHCRVIAASQGEISSERVYMRLERLTCINRKTKAILELKIEGYVAGEDGRVGVRGTVVMKDAALLHRSFIGGLLSGFGKGISQFASAGTSYNPFTGNVKQSAKGALAIAGSEGASSALDGYAKYYIDRAEQLQPVIQIAAGRKVDIVFTKGVNFSNPEAKKENELNNKGQDNALTEDTGPWITQGVKHV